MKLKLYLSCLVVQYSQHRASTSYLQIAVLHWGIELAIERKKALLKGLIYAVSIDPSSLRSSVHVGGNFLQLWISALIAGYAGNIDS